MAGFAPEVIVSGFDEEAVLIDDATELVRTLAAGKADVVAARPEAAGALVLGCDSALDVDGQVHGKPASPQEALERLRRLRGRTGQLVTGHCLLDTAHGTRAEAVESTTVHFGDYDDDELEAYVATGEPLQVAGAFTLDGYAAPFIAGVEGDPSNVIGLSLPVLRRLLRKLGVRVYDLWA